MDAGIKETKEQALKEMELFKTVFDGARLLDMHALELIGKGLGSYSLTESEQKFDFWEKEHPCNNDSCIVPNFGCRRFSPLLYARFVHDADGIDVPDWHGNLGTQRQPHQGARHLVP